jgi:hypothetical protein
MEHKIAFLKVEILFVIADPAFSIQAGVPGSQI